MKKIYFIIILGIFLVGTITASILITSKEKISDVNIISGQLMCDKLLENNLESYKQYCVREIIRGKQIILEPINLLVDVSSLDINLVKINNNQTIYEVKAK